MVVLMVKGPTMTKEPPFPPGSCGQGKKPMVPQKMDPSEHEKIMHDIGHCSLEPL
jgi:hypothetical protein